MQVRTYFLDPSREETVFDLGVCLAVGTPMEKDHPTRPLAARSPHRQVLLIVHAVGSSHKVNESLVSLSVVWRAGRLLAMGLEMRALWRRLDSIRLPKMVPV